VPWAVDSVSCFIKGGNDVTLVDGWPDHVNAIKENGLKANFNGEDITVNIPVMLQSEINSSEKADLIILFTKAMQLD
jgi:Ketopantoate reductase